MKMAKTFIRKLHHMVMSPATKQKKFLKALSCHRCRLSDRHSGRTHTSLHFKVKGSKSIQQKCKSTHNPLQDDLKKKGEKR